jgi:DNA-directed RNA polymerase sigma subunit (sigma70/sigma32)
MLKSQFGKSTNEIPNNFNDTVKAVKDQFIKDVVDRYLEQKHSRPINIDQKYIKDELQKIHNAAEGDDLMSQTKMFEQVFLKVQRPAVLAELKKLRKNSVTERALLDRLTEIWYRHSLHEISSSDNGDYEVPPIPRIVCGELL